jgi:hypothetical protein
MGDTTCRLPPLALPSCDVGCCASTATPPAGSLGWRAASGRQARHGREAGPTAGNRDDRPPKGRIPCPLYARWKENWGHSRSLRDKRKRRRPASAQLNATRSRAFQAGHAGSRWARQARIRRLWYRREHSRCGRQVADQARCQFGPLLEGFVQMELARQATSSGSRVGLSTTGRRTRLRST